MEPTLIPPQLDSLDEFLAAGPYVGYVYSYPHKTSYRDLDAPRDLSDVWREEPRDALFLYAHIPFCEMRCGFCNLFTYSQPDQSLPDAYLDSLHRQAETVRDAIGGARFARLALGGGTPTYLSETQLERLFESLRAVLGVEPERAPVSVETSPTTIDVPKAQLLKQLGVDRLSMGVQSWDRDDVGSMGRPQRETEVERAIGAVREAGLRTLNLDLIYGAEGQTTASWLRTLRRTLTHRPEEIYLYPLYVRPLTGLSARTTFDEDPRLPLYHAGRDLLLDQGYEQVSMRMFRLPTPGDEGPVYCCQEDGMIGLGCGARSYTRRLHYADEFAVRQASILQIIQRYIESDPIAWREVRRGFELDAWEQRRRYLLISLLNTDGLAIDRYQRRFGVAPEIDFPELEQLAERDLALRDDRWRLTAEGLAYSDAIGPWLYSLEVRRRMEAFAWQLA